MLKSVLDKTGYKRVVLKCDQEPATKALAMRVKETWHGEVLIEHSHVGDSKSNGEVERAVQEAQGIARNLKEHVERH